MALLFTENETNVARVFGTANPTPYVKDGINEYLVEGVTDAVNSACIGTKASAHFQLSIGAGESAEIRLRLADTAPQALKAPFGKNFATAFAARQREADEFYASITPPAMSADRWRSSWH